jgi:hypothetical protein
MTALRAVSPSDERLVALAAAAARGPQRDGLYALWLVVRAAESCLPPDPLQPRGHRRRLQAIETRLGTLALPAPLRRALLGARQHLEPGTAAAAALVLSELVAPTRDVLGAEAADAVAAAARAARAAGGRA